MLLDPIYSITTFGFYRKVPGKELLETFRYVAFLGILFSTALTYSLYLKVEPEVKMMTDWAATAMPEMTLAEGKLSSLDPGPVKIQHPESPELQMIIDTARTDSVTSKEMREAEATAYLTQDTVYILHKEQFQVYDLSSAKNEEAVKLDAEFYRSIGSLVTKVFYPIAFSTSCFSFLLWKLSAALFYSLLGILLNAYINANLEFPTLYKLAIYSQTPVIVLQTISLFLPEPIAYSGLLSIVVAGAYLSQAISQNKKEAAPA